MNNGEYKTMRKFQIRNKRDMGTSFYYFDADDSATEEQIQQKAKEEVNKAYEQTVHHAKMSIFPRPVRFAITLQVVEYEKHPTQFGGRAKRGGYKFTVSMCRVTSHSMAAV